MSEHIAVYYIYDDPLLDYQKGCGVHYFGSKLTSSTMIFYGDAFQYDKTAYFGY